MTVLECFRELVWLLRRGFPMSATEFFYTLMMPTTLAFCGSLGTIDMDAAGLAISVYQLTVENCATSVRWGLMPFLAQTMGGTKKYRVGNFVQRGLLAGLLFTCVNWAVALNTGNLLILLGQDPVISAKSEQFLIILMPGCLAMNLCEALIAYTDTVGYLWPTLVIRCVSLLVNILLQYSLVLRGGFGIVGSAAALSFSLAICPLMQAVFIWCLNIHRYTWAGWSARAFMDWGKFLFTVLPCLLTQTLWIFGTEYGNFLAGLMGAAEIAAESVVFQLNQLGYLIPIGIGSALIARIGFYLGSQQAEKAIRVVATSLTFMACIGAFVGTVFYLLRHQVPKIFSLEPAAEAIYISLAPYLSFYTAFQLAAYPSIAALRACSYHMHLLFMNFIAYYIVSMPLGVSLAFAAGWQLSGLWLGFVLGSFTFFALPSLYLLRLDWRQKALDAHANAEMETDMELLNERQPLMLAAAATSAATAGNLHPAGASAMASYQLSASVSQRQRNAVRSKLPVLAAAVALLIGSLFLRLLLPPRGPTAPAGHHGNGTASTTVGPVPVVRTTTMAMASAMATRLWT
ncbi:hypothetical protein BOX15_Mlig031687g1 [Macrostomum lignano]|uniref:Multidrug and toxin extrusion protein n=2 Tax=Macrostomum lignano TaxID=282301 RepID=A0A267EJH0_9PLAT|nr:hypothetical protein BOX15_Mlig031687g1 [Macrostomum lignano]